MGKYKDTLLDRDYCVNGHDVRDKENALYYRQDLNGRTCYRCIVCQSEAAKRHLGRPTTLDPKNRFYDLPRTLRSVIHTHLVTAEEEDLLTIYAFVKQVLNKPNKPVTDGELF
jgi:hypothetical protein